MVAHWMRVGFVHGVMNTDNMSILGLTIDYGPYGWIDNFDPDWTPNTTDAQGGRYRFGWQPKIAYWNLTRLAHALSPLFADADPLNAGLQRYMDAFVDADRDTIARKLGLAECRDEDIDLMQALHALLQVAEVDMTLFFRALADLDPALPSPAPVRGCLLRRGQAARGRAGTARVARALCGARLRDDPLPADARRARMHAANPKYVLRNYLAQQAIERAEAGRRRRHRTNCWK